MSLAASGLLLSACGSPDPGSLCWHDASSQSNKIAYCAKLYQGFGHKEALARWETVRMPRLGKHLPEILTRVMLFSSLTSEAIVRKKPLPLLRDIRRH